MFGSGRSGQLTLSFNWIFVLIAGTIILLFFVGLVMKQKSSSEQKLNYDVVGILDSILVGSTVSEKTINSIDTSGISDRELYFDCNLGSGEGFLDIFARYGVSGTSASQEIPTQVMFSPDVIQSKELILWSLPYEMPFKVMDFLILTGTSYQYYVFGGEGGTLRSELQNATVAMNIDFVRSTSEIGSIGANQHVRILDLDGSYVAEGAPVPVELMDAQDFDVSAIVLHSGGYDHYVKEGTVFTLKNLDGRIPIISLYQSDRDAAQIAALFSDGRWNYQCNMMKGFMRMGILTEVYQGKAAQLVDYYDVGSPTYDSQCLYFLDDELSSDDVVGNLAVMDAQLSSCTNLGYEKCLDVVSYAGRLAELNDELDNEGCTTLY